MSSLADISVLDHRLCLSEDVVMNFGALNQTIYKYNGTGMICRFIVGVDIQ